jgi:hypothetical protein
MNEDSLKQRINLELESISWNQLTEVGNQAVKLGLIAGHGYHTRVSTKFSGRERCY